MGGARALIASLGASISLVAGAALSLLFVSFLFAYDGLGVGAEEPTTYAALVVDAGSAGTSRQAGGSATRDAVPVVIRNPAPPAAREAVQRPARPDVVRESSAGVQTRPAPATTGVPDLGAAAERPATSNPGGSGPGTGDGVRDLGNGVSATVGETGAGAGDATAPLGPPVSQAVQDVLNVVQALLEGATGGLAGTIDTALPRR